MFGSCVALFVESGLGAEDLSPLTLGAEAPQVIEADIMLPLQAPSPMPSSPKVAESPDTRRRSAGSESAASLVPAAGTIGESSKSVASLPVTAASSSSTAAAGPLVVVSQLPLGQATQVMLRPVYLPPSPLQKAIKRGLRRTVLTVEGPADLLPLAELTPELTPPKPASSAPTPPPEKS